MKHVHRPPGQIALLSHLFGWRHENLVNDVDHAVAGFDISFDDLRRRGKAGRARSEKGVMCPLSRTHFSGIHDRSVLDERADDL